MFSHFSAVPQSGFSLLKPTPDRLSMTEKELISNHEMLTALNGKSEVKKELISDHEMLRARNGESEFRREIPIPPTNENTRIRSPYSLSEMIREINGMNGESEVKKELISNHEMSREMNGESEFRKEIPIPPTNENTRITSPSSINEMIRGMNGESEVKEDFISNHEMSGEMNVESEVSNEMSIPSNHENAKIISPSSIGEMVRAMNGESEVKKEFVSNHEMSREMNGESEVSNEMSIPSTNENTKFLSPASISELFAMNGEYEVVKEFISNHEMLRKKNGESEVSNEMSIPSTNENIKRLSPSSSIDQGTKKELHISAFESWDREKIPFPCVPESNSDNAKGIFYIKVPKASSSTLAHVTKRFAAKEARRQGFEEGSFCKTHDPMVHNSAFKLNCANRDKEKSFLWTVIRHPNDRAISHYGMKVSFKEIDTSDDQFVNMLRTNGAFTSDVQLKMLNLKNSKNLKFERTETIQKVLDEYNFIGIYERLHESLVVLQMLTDFHINDVLFSYKPLKNARCGSTEKPDWLSPNKESYLASEEWKVKNEGDFMLYDAVNKALDMTIEMLGPDKVQKKLQQYNHLLGIGTKLSSEQRGKQGCGVLFPTPYSDIDDLENFDTLSELPKKFVLGVKETLINLL